MVTRSMVLPLNLSYMVSIRTHMMIVSGTGSCTREIFPSFFNLQVFHSDFFLGSWTIFNTPLFQIFWFVIPKYILVKSRLGTFLFLFPGASGRLLLGPVLNPYSLWHILKYFVYPAFFIWYRPLQLMRGYLLPRL